MVYYKLNEELNGIELYFENIPSSTIRNQMKNVNLRWNPRKKCWYTKQWNKEGVKFIKDYCAKHGVNQNSDEKPAKILTFDSIMPKRCCYADFFSNFSHENENEFIEKIKSTFLKEHIVDLSNSQISAWKDSFKILQNLNLNLNISIIFEYVLPYESGRRPDVILLSIDKVIVLEFKMKNTIKPEDIDQVDAYARDLREYHYESRDKEIIPMLVLTKTTNLYKKEGNVTCISSDLLQNYLDKLYSTTIGRYDFNKWISSKYEPLPTIVGAARNFMNHEELPNIRRVNSTCIPQTLENLRYITDYARNNKKHVIAFVTGVPGAGKTYLGLQYVYDVETASSSYLSGNGPLVEVLQDALNSETFVRNIHKIIGEYKYSGAHDFNDNVIVFDEGQRAWDGARMEKRYHSNQSEPDVMVKICEERLDWCVLLILVGEGQEIHNGENSGIALWNVALNKSCINWEVVCPPKLSPVFSKQKILRNVESESFDLNVSLRSHLSGAVSKFVNYLMSGEINDAFNLSKIIYDEGYNMYCTRDLDKAKSYCRSRYHDEPEKKFGLIASSKDNLLKKYGIDNNYNTVENVNLKKWFNSPPCDINSSCALRDVITEFKIQGLELDMPIVCWESDMVWSVDNWKKFREWEDVNSDNNTFRKNSYRVLLTRGRDGFIIFVPPVAKLNSVYDILIKAGIKELTDFI